MTVDIASQRQNEAAEPGQNTWLTANAGSGKTRVLTDRVARLLLTNVPPQNILCLTYTKAAASEMQNRLLGRLGSWSMKSDEELRAELRGLGIEDIGDLDRARRLFAEAIETPGGLKIQTIHSFCAAILRRFPLEAGVSPDFQEIDKRTAARLIEEIADEMATGDERPLVEGLAEFLPESEFTSVLADIVTQRAEFERPANEDEIRKWFSLPPGYDEKSLLAEVFSPTDGSLLRQLAQVLATGSKKDRGASEKLSRLSDVLSVRDLPILEDVFLFGEKAKAPFSAKIGDFPTKNIREGPAASLMPEVENLMRRVEDAREPRLALQSAKKSLALHRFARPFLARYAQRKQIAGWLDFDDLITIAGRLLTAPELAAWVLYRLDGGIDHILVDEAQDTSPAQWQVIESLAHEFTAGSSARSDRSRTLFVVGDVKQSIYSFQGADPDEFAKVRDRFKTAFEQVGHNMRPLQLEHSFRSSPAILDMVDHTFHGVEGLGDDKTHIAFHPDSPGRVDLWPSVATAEKPEKTSWTDPVDAPSPQHADVILADKIAEAIKEMLEKGSIPDKNGAFRAITPGDIMVLVRRRSELFHQIIRACKNRKLPIAGADRLRIEAELAVRDIVAVLSFLATPEDDLSLAAALRSPVFGLTEDALFRLAHNRGNEYLWHALRNARDEHPQAVEILNDLRGSVDFLRPYELVERLLTRHGARRRLIARLGREAEDGIDALLSQALEYESLEVPSLTGFLTWFSAGEVEVKRQTDSASDQIRVMTVHGAKGLESAVVFLPDTAKRRPRGGSRLLRLPDQSGLVWRTSADEAPDVLRTALAERNARTRKEDMRLLYVAMTRAKSWLVIAGAGDTGAEEDQSCWYRIAESGLKKAACLKCDFPTGHGLRLEHAGWAARPPHEDAKEAVDEPLPQWTRTAPPKPEHPAEVLNPSALGGPKIISAENDDAAQADPALIYGDRLHRLLEMLPGIPSKVRETAAAELLNAGDGADRDEIAELVMDAKRLLDRPELAFLFAPGTLAEVEISSPLPTDPGSRIHGVIDRLLVSEDHVLAVDFKTNRTIPARPEDVPEGILRQMGAYEVALAETFPSKRIDTGILWTRSAQFMPLPAGLALRAFGSLDATHGPT